MSDLAFKILLLYAIAVASAYLLKRVTFKIARKAIAEEKLSTGIYRLYPVNGERAMKIARGYMRGVTIYFWFVVLFFPLIFTLSLV